MGIQTIAVFSATDAGAPHVRDADRAIAIGPAPAKDSYLSIDRILAAARESGADAVHPGYGFLSENADFAEAVTAAGMIFVGPSSQAMRLMGDKRAAKIRMRAAGVPCIPGWEGESTDTAELMEAAKAIGLPVMIKAVAGGGGRGMRRVGTEADLVPALESARSEAISAFGDGRLILEKAIDHARHIEVQIFGDRHGALVHLGERDCSVQRRHQKVIEESPAPGIDPMVRQHIIEAALQAARAVDYCGAGTVEFLLDRDGGFYFLEMNTRLQVEHCVTEAVTGFDLVEWQIRVARGEPLPLLQDRILFSGHAIEARLYAEDPSAGYLPQAGSVHYWRAPEGSGVRIEHALETGIEIGSYYDPMIAKIIAHGDTREIALARLRDALRDTITLGITTNKRQLGGILKASAFVDGTATTDFLENSCGENVSRDIPPRLMAIAAALWFEATAPEQRDTWRNSGSARWPMTLRSDGGDPDVIALTAKQDRRYRITRGKAETSVELHAAENGSVTAIVDSAAMRVHAVIGDGVLMVDIGDGGHRVEDVTYQPAPAADAGADGKLLAPMAGRVLEVTVAPGEPVAAGRALVTMEAMKLEHRLLAPIAGTATLVAVKTGDQVAARQILVEIAPEETEGGNDGN